MRITLKDIANINECVAKFKERELLFVKKSHSIPIPKVQYPVLCSDGSIAIVIYDRYYEKFTIEVKTADGTISIDPNMPVNHEYI